jgi:uncharacterized protein (DUF1015 family)
MLGGGRLRTGVQEVDSLAQIQPFPGIVYRVPSSELNQVLAPPYDVIPPAYQEELYARDPRNIVRVVLNRKPGDAGYEDAGATYRGWLSAGVLASDPQPALYVLEQTFEAEGQSYVRHGVLARFKAEPPETGVIRPHEHTRAVAKEDRWRVLNATKANFSPIFLMVPDADRAFAGLLASALSGAPAMEYTDDGGVAQRVFRITDSAAVEPYVRLLGARSAYIADGHHRHATALRYAAAVGPDGAWTLGYFTPMGASGLVVLPYHRILSSGPSLAEAETVLGAHFPTRRFSDVHSAALATQASRAGYAFALAEPGGAALLVEAPREAGFTPAEQRRVLGGVQRSTPPLNEAPREAAARLAPGTPACLAALDTYFLHHAILKPLLNVPDEAVSYVHSLGEAEDALRHNNCRLAVLLRSTPVQQIVDVADAHESMPAKSTFFHPKLPSGLVIHPLLA